ncbi:hypothetical protein AB6A40_009110 [Gnathostoma spinigerum]|uniref:DNA-directed RNA polymerase subunit n=1 Tax=Gnathostoma spinigerum TaxID=75299 RepID=A0ABD6ERC2_9BILA
MSMRIVSNSLLAGEEFCARCGTIVPIPQTAPCTVRCALCNYKWTVKPIIDKLVYRSERVYERRLTVAEDKEKVEDPVIDRICEKCGFDKMSYTCRQTRSADEGQTVYYTCLNPKCKHCVVENA